MSPERAFPPPGSHSRPLSELGSVRDLEGLREALSASEDEGFAFLEGWNAQTFIDFVGVSLKFPAVPELGIPAGKKAWRAWLVVNGVDGLIAQRETFARLWREGRP